MNLKIFSFLFAITAVALPAAVRGDDLSDLMAIRKAACEQNGKVWVDGKCVDPPNTTTSGYNKLAAELQDENMQKLAHQKLLQTNPRAKASGGKGFCLGHVTRLLWVITGNQGWWDTSKDQAFEYPKKLRNSGKFIELTQPPCKCGQLDRLKPGTIFILDKKPGCKVTGKTCSADGHAGVVLQDGGEFSDADDRKLTTNCTRYGNGCWAFYPTEDAMAWVEDTYGPADLNGMPDVCFPWIDPTVTPLSNFESWG